MTARIDSLRLVGDLGMNKIMAGELSRLSRRALGDVRLPRPNKAGSGALVYPLDEIGQKNGRRLAALAVHYHRSATRVLWDLYASRARSLDGLFEDVREAVAGDDRPVFRGRVAISVQAKNVGHFPAGERQVVGTVKNAIADGAARQGAIVTVAKGEPDVAIAVRMHDDVVTVSVDLAGRSKSHRGYRERSGGAPVRETLAAALVMLCRHDARSEALVDPMGGTGTIAIEAALMGRGAPLWTDAAPPASERLPGFSLADVWAPGEPLYADTRPAVLAADIDPEAVSLARAAANAAGTDVAVVQSDFRELSRGDIDSALGGRAGRGVILSNPPYGKRMGAGSELGPLYRDLGAFCRQFRGWRAGFIVASDEFKPAFGGRPRVEKPIRTGGLSARFLLYDL